MFTSDSVDGDYTYRRSFRPNGNMSRDDTLFKDDDGKAYFVSAANENADSDAVRADGRLPDIARQITTLLAGQLARGAGDVQGGRPLLLDHLGGDRLGLRTRPSTRRRRRSKARGARCRNLGNAHDLRHAVGVRHPGVRDAARRPYIYAGDRWQDPDLGSSKYIWLPLKVTRPEVSSLDYYPDWQLNSRPASGRAGDEHGSCRRAAGRCSASTAKRPQARTATPPTRSTTPRRRSGTRTTAARNRRSRTRSSSISARATSSRTALPAAPGRQSERPGEGLRVLRERLEDRLRHARSRPAPSAAARRRPASICRPRRDATSAFARSARSTARRTRASPNSTSQARRSDRGGAAQQSGSMQMRSSLPELSSQRSPTTSCRVSCCDRSSESHIVMHPEQISIG